MNRPTLPSFVGTIFLLLLQSACAVPKYQFDRHSSWNAVAGGESKQALAFYEAEARDAEKHATASLFPQEYWKKAWAAYREASYLARSTGELQKAITYGERSLEMAQKARDPLLQLAAHIELITVYNSVRDFDTSRSFIDKGFEVVKQIPITTSRTGYEALLYRELGHDLVRRQKYENAIDAFSQQLRLHQAYLSVVRNQKFVDVGRHHIISTLSRLADTIGAQAN